MGRPSKYTVEFGREALELVRSSGRPVAEVARSLEMNEGTLGNCQLLSRVPSPCTSGFFRSASKKAEPILRTTG